MFAESAELSMDRFVAEGSPAQRDWFRFLLDWFTGHYDDVLCFKFSICEALFCFACDWHNGQWSPEYELHAWLDREQFVPSSCLDSDHLGEDARMIYDFLVEHKEELF
jgi:hypothetical protein